MPKKLYKIILVLFISAASAFSQRRDEPKILSEIEPFIEKDMKAIALEEADLNGDGRSDYILVLDTIKEDDSAGDAKRPLLILTRDAGGRLTLAARSFDVVYCRECGGVYGDPFDGVSVRQNGFVVANAGGGGSRWLENYEFQYSPRAETWLLVRAVFTSYDVFRPELMKTKNLTRKDFGKVSLADFSPSIFSKNN